MDLIIVLLIIGLPLCAQLYINSTYRKNIRKKPSNDLNGYDVARKILDKNGLNDMLIVETRGNLTDHYDPTRKVIKLSTDIYNTNSIASIAVAAHEAGHAIQDKEGYTFLKIRSFIFPIVSLLSRFSYLIIFLGFLFEIMNLVYLGIIAVSSGLLFQIITLPVEINASKRALKEIEELNITNEQDKEGITTVLKAAALTYVASTLAELLQLLRLIGMARDN